MKSTNKAAYNVRYSGLDTIIENRFQDVELYANRHARLHDGSDQDNPHSVDSQDSHGGDAHHLNKLVCISIGVSHMWIVCVYYVTYIEVYLGHRIYIYLQWQTTHEFRKLILFVLYTYLSIYLFYKQTTDQIISCTHWYMYTFTTYIDTCHVYRNTQHTLARIVI